MTVVVNGSSASYCARHDWIHAFQPEGAAVRSLASIRYQRFSVMEGGT